MVIQGLIGLFMFLVIAGIMSEDRQSIAWRAAVGGVLLQVVLGWTMLNVEIFRTLFIALNQLVVVLELATMKGTSFVFGFLGGGELPYVELRQGSTFVLAFQALPMILVISAASALLFYWRILPQIVRFMAFLLRKSMKVSGPAAVSAGANVFLGMMEAMLLVRPYLKRLTRSELFTVMTCGMATVSGTVMVLYAKLLEGVIENSLGHIIVASIISVPAAITISKIMVPGDNPTELGAASIPPSEATSSLDAITRGTADGLSALLNIVAMLIVMVALIHLGNNILDILPNVGGEPITLQRTLGWIMAPLAFLMGVEWEQAHIAGKLLGIKVVLNEIIAYAELVNLPTGTLDERSKLIMTYALCGFANLGSVGIMLGGLSQAIPERREEVIHLGIRSVIAGTIATCMTGTVVGLVG